MIPTRSVLITPGTRLDRYFGTKNLAADAVMFDFEDSVPLDNKDEARRNWCSLTKTSVRRGSCVRMNSLSSPDGIRDLNCIFSAEVKPDLIFVPKTESAAAISLLGSILENARVDTQIAALVETPMGILNAPSIASSSPRLTALAFGTADFSMALGTGMDWETMLPARSALIMAAKAAGIEVIDSPSFDFQNDLALKEDCRRAKEIGFTAKFAIHPCQLNQINEHFRPDDAAVEWAVRVLNASTSANTNITTMDGMMIGPPFVKRARVILAARELEL